MEETDTGRPHAAHEHTPHLAHHFDTPAQQFGAGKLGMWIFLATEILLFGGLFCAYAVYRSNHPEIFEAGHVYLNKYLGGINTVVLILSSFTMATGVYCAQRSLQTGLKVCLALTLLGGCGFMSIKYVEYHEKWKHGLLWGTRYAPHVEEHAPDSDDASETETPAPASAPATQAAEEASTIAPAAIGPRGLILSGSESGEPPHPKSEREVKNVHIFFGIYFLMTGLHGLHVLAGMTVITWLLVRAFKGHFGATYFTPVDLGGLYWHLVDLIWIFLFPLLYLIT